MGKNKKVRNWKARQVVEGVIDDKETKQLEAQVIQDEAQVKIYFIIVIDSVFHFFYSMAKVLWSVIDLIIIHLLLHELKGFVLIVAYKQILECTNQ
jgi:hypothetical protein